MQGSEAKNFAPLLLSLFTFVGLFPSAQSNRLSKTDYIRGLAIASQIHEWQTMRELLQDMGSQAAQCGNYAQSPPAMRKA